MATASEWKDVIVRVRAVTAAEVGADQGSLTKATGFVGDLAIDARASARLRRALEKEFGIEIPKGDTKELTTVGDLTRYVHGRLAEDVTTPDS